MCSPILRRSVFLSLLRALELPAASKSPELHVCFFLRLLKAPELPTPPSWGLLKPPELLFFADTLGVRAANGDYFVTAQGVRLLTTPFF